MLKNISNLGQTLTKAEQKAINGGRRLCESGCSRNSPCCSDGYCLDRINDNPFLTGRQCITFL